MDLLEVATIDIAGFVFPLQHRIAAATIPLTRGGHNRMMTSLSLGRFEGAGIDLLYSAVGQIEQIDGEVCVVTRPGASGCALYGPYRVLTPGNYEVEFHVMPHEIDSRPCCIVDVLRHGLTVTAEKDFTADELIRRNGIVRIRFEVVIEDTYEFRVSATGGAGLTIKFRRPLREWPAPRPSER